MKRGYGARRVCSLIWNGVGEYHRIGNPIFSGYVALVATPEKGYFVVENDRDKKYFFSTFWALQGKGLFWHDTPPYLLILKSWPRTLLYAVVRKGDKQASPILGNNLNSELVRLPRVGETYLLFTRYLICATIVA